MYSARRKRSTRRKRPPTRRKHSARKRSARKRSARKRSARKRSARKRSARKRPVKGSRKSRKRRNSLKGGNRISDYRDRRRRERKERLKLYNELKEIYAQDLDMLDSIKRYKNSAPMLEAFIQVSKNVPEPNYQMTNVEANNIVKQLVQRKRLKELKELGKGFVDYKSKAKVVTIL